MDAAQVCDRLQGQETCPFHKGHNITSLCKSCGILVCLKCMMSSDHEGHTFKEITSCLRESTDNLAKHITEIDKSLLIAVQKELSEMKKQRVQSVEKHTNGAEQIKEQRQQAHLQIDMYADTMEAQWNGNLQQVLEVLDKHILGLESLENQLKEERNECSEILQKGSNILKYDAGLEITKKTKMQRIPNRPTISELEYKKCDQNFNDLLLKAMGIIKEVNSKPGGTELPEKYLASSSEIVEQHRYQLIESISNITDNKPPSFAAITPIGTNVAWARDFTYDGRNDKYLSSNMLYLINSRRNVVQQIKLDTKIFNLNTHPITRQLFCINDDEDRVKSIDTTTGKTTQILKSSKHIQKLKVTDDNHVIVGSLGFREAIYKYKLTGELVNKSKEKYQVFNIDYCPQTNRVAISSIEEGVTLLSSELIVIKNYNRKNFCSSVIFDSHGNLIAADFSKKQIIVLDGENLSFIQKLEIDGITTPDKLKLYDNILWVICNQPAKLICIRIS